MEGLFDFWFVTARMEAYDVGRTGGGPYRTIVRLFEVHRHENGPLSQYPQTSSVILALHDEIGCREPQQSVAVTEDMGHGILRL